MPLPTVKKGSSAGRVRMAYSFPQSTLVNYYVGGAGVGAVNTSNRRALRRRASWRPASGGLAATRCTGFCQPNRFADDRRFVEETEEPRPFHNLYVSLKNTTSQTVKISANGVPIVAPPFSSPVTVMVGTFTNIVENVLIQGATAEPPPPPLALPPVQIVQAVWGPGLGGGVDSLLFHDATFGQPDVAGPSSAGAIAFIDGFVEGQFMQLDVTPSNTPTTDVHVGFSVDWQ
jgi:hypothetical protein